MQYMDYTHTHTHTNASKINEFEKESMFCRFFVFFSLPNTEWCFILTLGILSYATHISKQNRDEEKPA